MKSYLFAACTLGMIAACSAPSFGQTTNTTVTPAVPAEASTPPPSTSTSAPVATMKTIVVTAPTATTTDSVLPTDTPVSSVFGSDIPIQDTPRSVTVLSPEILQSYDVRSLQDLSKTAPSSYQTDQFGGYSVPNIRGQDAEVFINGQQRTTRSDGPPTSFNSVESADIVNGPASSVYGPTGYTGGYLNLVTKQPFFDAWHDTTSFTYGSYDTKRWTEDIGAPIIPGELAFRASYEGEDSGSYYNNVETKSQDGFFALKYTPSSDFHVDFNTEFQDVRFDENTGWNRPTQSLIDEHNYVTGAYTFGFPAFVAATGLQRLSPSSTLIAPSDSDYAKDYNAQMTTTYDPGDGFSIVNRTYYEYEYLRNTELAQYYSNLITSNNVQDRLEFHIDFDTPIDTSSPGDPKDAKSMAQIGDPLSFKHEIITGLAFKYIGLTDYQGFLNEFLNATDLTTNTYPLVSSSGVPGPDSLLIPGTNMFGSSGGNYGTAGFPYNQPGTVAEQAYEESAFFQHNITFTPQWSLLYGVRGDLLFDSISDPLPPSGFTPAGDSTTVLMGSGNVSVDYKPASWITNYLTFSFNQSYQGNTGGGFNTFTTNNNLSGASYHLKNFLYEGGSKINLLDDKLFLTGAGYYQTHAAVTALGGITEIRTLGGELGQVYQPDKHFFLSFNESYLDAVIVNPTAEFTETTQDITGNNGTPNFIVPPPGHYRESGLPQFLLNGIASYTLDNGLGASMSYQITDPIPTSEVDPVWIPWQYEIDASLFYKQKNWEAQLNFFNITDQHNFSTGGFIAGTGNDLITIGEPFHMEGTLTYKF